MIDGRSVDKNAYGVECSGGAYACGWAGGRRRGLGGSAVVSWFCYEEKAVPL